MTPERLAEIETLLLRGALSAPLDDRQRFIKLGLELVEGLQRCELLKAGAREQCERVRKWYGATRELLTEALGHLDAVPSYAMPDGWHASKTAFVQKVRDQ